MMKRYFYLTVVLTITGILTGCGDSEPVVEDKAGSHVWKGQTDNLQTAKDAAADLSASMQMKERMSHPTE